MAWHRIVDGAVVPARPAGLWTLVADFVPPVSLLKLVADPHDRWSYADSREAICGPDGDRETFLARTDCLCPAAPVGALIGKIGGSAAGEKDSAAFTVGSSCVIAVPDGGGPLFLTINDEFSGMENNSDSITVTVYVRPAPRKADAATK